VVCFFTGCTEKKLIDKCNPTWKLVEIH